MPQSSFYLPLSQLRYHSLHSTYHFVSYCATVFCLCTSLPLVMQQSSFLVQRKKCRRDYSNSKETGRRKYELYNDTRIFFFASSVHRCPKISAQPTLLRCVQPCVIFIAATWCCKRIVVQIRNSSKCWQRISQRVAAGRVRDIGQNV